MALFCTAFPKQSITFKAGCLRDGYIILLYIYISFYVVSFLVLIFYHLGSLKSRYLQGAGVNSRDAYELTCGHSVRLKCGSADEVHDTRISIKLTVQDSFSDRFLN